VAGPLVRLTEERMRRFGDAVVGAAGELAMASATSPLFARRRK
jgi:IclR family transcriptional regulator, acetate operon repressor